MDQDFITFGRTPAPGEPTSLRDLYDASHDRLVARLYAVTGDRDQAEDAVREAFVRAVASGDRFWRVGHPEERLSASAVRAHRRRRRRRAGTPARSGPPPESRAEPEPAPPSAFHLVEVAGLARRRHHHAVAGILAAGVLVTSAVITEVGGGHPAGPPATERPSPVATTTSAVTPPRSRTTVPGKAHYELASSTDRSLPAVRVTLPTTWSSWLGPGRSDGLAARLTRDELVFLDEPGTYVGLLVADVTRVARTACTTSDLTGRGAAPLVRALAAIPRLEVVAGPVRTVRAGRPAWRLRLQERGRELACPRAPLFETPRGRVTGGEGGATYEAWVVDVRGAPLLVWAGWTRSAPASEVAALLATVDSVALCDQHRTACGRLQ